MKNKKLIFAVATLALFGSSHAFAADLKVIANSSVSADSISGGDLQAVFLLDKDSVGGSHVDPVLEKGGPAHEALLKVVGKSDPALQAFYRSLVFTGKASMPKELGSDAEVAAYVAKTKGAIGCVSADASAPGTKTLAVK